MAVRFCSTCAMLMDPSAEMVEDETGRKTYHQVFRCPCGQIDRVDTVAHPEFAVHELTFQSTSKMHPKLSYHFSSDPTLKMARIDCPNPECPTHTSAELENRVVVYQYDKDRRNGFVCTHCRADWHN